EACAEVVERELAAELLERVDEAVGLGVTRDGRRLRDLEADARGIEPAHLELVDDERQELLVAEALPGEVDRAEREPLALVRLGNQPAEGAADHPAIDVRGEAVTLGRLDKQAGRD